MKNSIVFKNTWLVLAILSITFVSCKKSPEYLQLIPEDSAAVITVDLMSLGKKANMKEVSQMEFYKSLQTELETENKQLADLLDEISKNPSKSGIDFRHNLTFFVSEIKERDVQLCLTMELKNAKKFKEMAGKLAATADKTLSVQEGTAFEYTVFDSTSILAWDAKKALLVFHLGDDKNIDLLPTAEKLFAQEINLTGNSEFNDFLSHKKDLNFWMNMSFITSIPEIKEQLVKMGGDMFTGTYMKMYTSFENGKIESKSQIVPNEAMKALYDSTKLFDKKFNSEILTFLPEQNYLSIGYAVNMKGYYNMMANQPQFKEAIANMETQMGLNLEQLMESLAGSILINIHGFTPIPLFSLSFDVNDSEQINQLVSKLTGTEVVDNAITSINLVFLELHFISKDGLCYLTNDKAVAEAVGAGVGLKDNLKSTTIGKNIAKHPAYMFMNLNLDEYPAEIVTQLKSNPKVGMVVDMIDSYAKNAEMKVINNYNVELTLTTNESNKNSLYTLLSLIDEYYEQITEL